MTMMRFAFAALCIASAASPAVAQSHVVALSESDEGAYRDAFRAIEGRDWRGVTSALNRVD